MCCQVFGLGWGGMMINTAGKVIVSKGCDASAWSRKDYAVTNEALLREVLRWVIKKKTEHT